MKQFAVNVDITMSKTIYVEAENENEAIELANEKVNNDPYEAIRNADAYVDHYVVDTYEIDD